MGAYPSEIAKPLPGREFPSRSDMNQGYQEWLAAKRTVDTEHFGFDAKYWCIHNKLYDLTPFLSKHPGGSSWLTMMQGTDCTAAFETHHINIKKVKSILSAYYVRDLPTISDSDNNNNSNDSSLYKPHSFDWDESNGSKVKYFELRDLVYKHLSNKYPSKDKLAEWQKSPLMMQFGSILAVTVWFLTFINLIHNPNIINGIISGLFLHPLIGVGHNYFHQSDNKQLCCYFRYFFNLTMFPWRDWRVSHVLSHHTYINLDCDYEISALEPVMFVLNNKRTNSVFIYLYSYIFFFALPLVSYLRFWIQVAVNAIGKYVLQMKPFVDKPPILNNLLHWENNIPLMQLFVLYYFNQIGLTLWQCAGYWAIMHGVSSLVLITVSTPIHRSDDCWTEGTPGGTKCYLENTLMTTKDYAIELHPILSLFCFEMFNDHRLHHLFPTLDIYRIKEIRPIFEEYCRRKDVNLGKYFTHRWTLWELSLGHWRNWYKIEITATPASKKTK